VKKFQYSPASTSFHLSLHYMESQVFKIVKLILHVWHSKLHLSILLNRMASPQNCLYRKSTLIVMLTLHLWQITIKFNIIPLTVIKLLPSLILNLWQSLSLGLCIKAETSDANFNITPLASIHCWVQQYTYSYGNEFPSNFHIRVEITNAKFKFTPLALPPLLS